VPLLWSSEQHLLAHHCSLHLPRNHQEKISKYFRPTTPTESAEHLNNLANRRVTMSSNIGDIAQLLDATLDPSKHRKGTDACSIDPGSKQLSRLTCKPAESALKEMQTKPGYCLNLLNIVASEPLPVNTRLAASLAFKNFIRNNYVVRGELLENVWPVGGRT
jgi:hypothetical protein